MPPDLEVSASGVVEFRIVGFVADVQRTRDNRRRDVEYLTVEVIEACLGGNGDAIPVSLSSGEERVFDDAGRATRIPASQ